MITINGITFRNLEEQVAYLSENFPYFTIEGSELVIKLEDGTEIARISMTGLSDMSVAYSSDTYTITKTLSDGTSTSYTIDLTPYLKKVSTTTTVMQAYIKQTNGAQQMIDVHWNNNADTIPIRDQTGNIRVALTPTTPSHATSKQYVDNAIAGVSFTRYKHSVKATFVDGCDEAFIGIIIFESSSNTPLTTTTFKQLFNFKLDENNTIYALNIPCNQGIYQSGYEDAIRPSFLTYDSNVDYFFDQLQYDQGGMSSSFSLSSISDTITTL